jgi:glutathione synthase/RimK-type ligase-like ATP-grasp enzyme
MKKRIKAIIARKVLNIASYIGLDEYILTKYRNKKVLSEAENLSSGMNFNLNWPDSKKKPNVGLVKDDGNYSYYEKYEKLLLFNNFNFKYFDITTDDFILKASKYDLIICRVPSELSKYTIYYDRLLFLKKFLKINIYPNIDDLWFYESKIRQNWLFNFKDIPHIPTFVSSNKTESLDYLETVDYPIVFKESTASRSLGVYLIKNKNQGIKLTKKIFSRGLNSSLVYNKIKDYVYFQKYIESTGFDLRIIIVGEKFFGYYRYSEKNDFRASGSGKVSKKDLPFEVLKLASEIYNKLEFKDMIAIDFIQKKSNLEYLVIEVSNFFSIETSLQTQVNGVPGYYHYNGLNFQFKEGQMWVQELALYNFIKNYYIER